MGDMVLIQKIVKLSSLLRAIQRQYSKSAKFAIPLQTLPAHDERLHHRLAYSRQFDECLPDACRGHLQYLALLRFATGAREGSRPHQHRNIANEISWPGI